MYEVGVNIRGLCQFIGGEGVNNSWELAESKDHILAQIIKKYIIGSKQTSIKT